VTTNQKETIKFIIRHRSRFAESPTIREIVEELKLSGPASAVGIVNKLIELGYLEKDNSTSRTLIPTKKALEEFELGSNDLIFEGSEDEVLVQPSREFERDDVTISNPTMSTGSYDRLKIESNGTSIKNDVNTNVQNFQCKIFSYKTRGNFDTGIFMLDVLFNF
jgi:SOS-response transcriptional repressor LexA